VRLSVWSPAVSALRCSVGCVPQGGMPSHKWWDSRPSQPGMTERANTVKTFILRDPIAVEPQNRQQCGGRSPTLRHLSWLPSSRPSLTRVDSYPFRKPRFAARQSFVAYATKPCHRSLRIAAGGAKPVAGPEPLWEFPPAESGTPGKRVVSGASRWVWRDVQAGIRAGGGRLRRDAGRKRRRRPPPRRATAKKQKAGRCRRSGRRGKVRRAGLPAEALAKAGSTTDGKDVRRDHTLTASDTLSAPNLFQSFGG